MNAEEKTSGMEAASETMAECAAMPNRAYGADGLRELGREDVLELVERAAAGEKINLP
ncbi:MAG: hypothetical protein K6C36_04480 [Clostridia bacterium]|nr:hypothetical protein [Clostridia bacterium]